jgi:hypothetical protein
MIDDGHDRLEWRRSGSSANHGPRCVETASAGGPVHLLRGARLALPAARWSAFVAFAAGRS